MEKVVTCSMTDGNGSYHGLALSFFEEMTRCRRQKHYRRRPDNPNGPSKFRKYRASLPLLRLFTSARLLLLFHGSGSCHAPAPSYFEKITRCGRKKLDWRWPGNPNGRSKFRNLGLFTFTRSQLTLRWRLRDFWRLLVNTQTVRHRRQKHRQDDQDRLKFCKYENLCLWNQEKRLEKLLFPATNAAAIDGIAHCFFACYHWQQLLFSHSKNNFSTTLTPPPKNRDIHIVEFVL